MAEMQDEHIDQWFAAAFAEVEVKFNPAHWEKLSAALNARPDHLPAEGKLRRLLRSLGNLRILSIVAIGTLGLTVFLWLNRTTPPPAQPSVEEPIPGAGTSQTTASPDTTVTGIVIQESIGEKRNDTTSVLMAVTSDTTDTMAADTSKKLPDNFIFWQ
ncbi:MAG: hypothetical protein JNM00_13605 [Flavobacteriales bacterium]|nr:hypothetical protein [Flavobacteriales bacterium]